MNIEKTVAKNLLDIQAVSLQPNNPLHGQAESNHQSTVTTVWYFPFRKSALWLCKALWN